MKTRSNEQLCVLAQKGDENARSLLLEKNYGFIRQTAAELYRSMNLGESDLGIEMDDLTQEGSIGLLDAISRFDSIKGIKFLTYAAPSIKNAMTNLVRSALAQYEQRMTDPKGGQPFQEIRLDEVLPGDEQMLRIEAIANPTAKSPEQIYLDRETMRELYEGLGKLSEREQTYLLYRYGFTDETEHTLIGTAIHFSLRESRAKKLEEEAMDNLWLELPWWF